MIINIINIITIIIANYLSIVIFFYLYSNVNKFRKFINYKIIFIFNLILYNIMNKTNSEIDFFEYIKDKIQLYRNFISKSSLNINNYESKEINNKNDLMLSIFAHITSYKPFIKDNQFDIDSYTNNYLEKYKITNPDKKDIEIFKSYHKLIQYIINKYVSEEEVKRLLNMKDMILNNLKKILNN